MANYITISTIGAEAVPGDPDVNREAVDRMIEHWNEEFNRVLPDKPDLILVPECCDRYPGHSMEKRKEYYRFRGHSVGDFFAETARNNNCYIAYPAVREMEDGSWRNSIELFGREGRSMGFYNKNYPVTTENIEGSVLSGREAELFKCDFGTVGGVICFDLNFDGIRKKYVESRPDLILFASMYHGGLMQNYWAYSCRSHVVTAICGLPSSIISPVGEVVASSTNYFDFVTVSINLDCMVAHLDFNQEKIKDMKNKYGPAVRVFDPGYLGAVLISSEAKQTTCKDLIREFDIELLDNYLKRSAAHAENPKNTEL